MKILHVTKKYPDIMGGDSTVVACLEKYQKKIGHQVYILTSNCNEIRKSLRVTKYGLKINALGIDRINLNRIISLFILFFYSFFYLKKIKPDIIHSHSPDLGFILSFTCKLYKIPIINQCHGVSFSYKQSTSAKRIIEKFCLKYSKFNKIITVDKNSLSSFKKINIKNVIYMPNGVELEKFNEEKKKNTNKTIFLFVGRLEKQKGLMYLIEAINILKAKDSKFEVHLIGEGSEEVYLKKLVSKFDSKKYIKFLGGKTFQEIAAYYTDSDVFILPSIWEGFPLTLLEAWAARLPVIITNVGGITKICANKENALIIPSKDSKKVSEAMMTLIKDQNLRRKLGENGRKLVEKKYNWENITKEVEKIYKEVLSK